jgi:hypothetical protein
VDVLVVNDNSGLARSDNVAALERSAFAARGALHVRRHRFVDFADMRNRAFEDARALVTDPAPDWMLFLDADEVHGEQVRYIAREILPRLRASVGSVDAYTNHLYGTFRWVTDTARRFCFYRYSPGLRWENAVHEKVRGLLGSSLVVPYTYQHYGNVVPPAALAQKYGVYYALGNDVPEPVRVSDATAAMFVKRAADVRPYRGTHPASARATLAALEAEFAEEFAIVDAGFVAHRDARMRAASRLRGINEAVRVALRRVEHPLLYRETTAAR